ncbi:MAG: SDR family oxidoreductase [Cyanobacteria bacterium]|nr:SDR family oxidoreductase [Cyanobacteriota bacterium]
MESSGTDTDVLQAHRGVNPGSPSPLQGLVLGAGFTGRRFAQALRDRGARVRLTDRRGPRPEDQTDDWLRFDPSAGEVPEAHQLEGVTHVLVTIPPNAQGSDPVLTTLSRTLASLPLQWVGYLSTTGVYGDHGGDWVREDSALRPRLERSQARLACEQAWRSSGLPVQVFRLPAIYGPGRSAFDNLRNDTARLIHKPGQVFSRVHVDDIVGALMHCLAMPPEVRPETVIVADREPCPSSENLGFAAHLLGCKLPPWQRWQDVGPTMGPMARSFWSENRRASSELLCDSLGYTLRYPSYREGLRACVNLT